MVLWKKKKETPSFNGHLTCRNKIYDFSISLIFLKDIKGKKLQFSQVLLKEIKFFSTSKVQTTMVKSC